MADYDPASTWEEVQNFLGLHVVSVNQMAPDGTVSPYTGFAAGAAPSAVVTTCDGMVGVAVPSPGLVCTWVSNDPAAGKILVTLPQAVTAALPPGEYGVLVGVLPQGGGDVPLVYRAAMVVYGGPGGTLPTALSHAVTASEVIQRCRGLIADDGGIVPSFRSPATWAARQCGVLPASPLMVSDAELAAINPANHEKYFDAATYQSLNYASMNYDLVKVSGVDFSKEVQQIYDRLKDAVTRLEAYILKRWGIGTRGGARIATGSIAPSPVPLGLVIPGMRSPVVQPGTSPWTGRPYGPGSNLPGYGGWFGW